MNLEEQLRSLFERKYLVTSIPGRCVRQIRKIPKNQEREIKEKLEKARANSESEIEAHIIVKDLFGNVIRKE